MPGQMTVGGDDAHCRNDGHMGGTSQHEKIYVIPRTGDNKRHSSISSSGSKWPEIVQEWTDTCSEKMTAYKGRALRFITLF
jgi:hypothetical protein